MKPSRMPLDYFFRPDRASGQEISKAAEEEWTSLPEIGQTRFREYKDTVKKKRHIIRNAGFGDARAIYDIIKRHPQQLVPRPISDIVQNIDRFIVCEYRGEVVGTASWGILPEIGRAAHPTIEIKSVAVEKKVRDRGIGRDLVDAAIERVKILQPEQIIVLTFSPEFFAKFGFEEVPKESLMHKLYSGCLNCTKYDSPFTCPEVAMSLAVNPQAS